MVLLGLGGLDRTPEHVDGAIRALILVPWGISTPAWPPQITRGAGGVGVLGCGLLSRVGRDDGCSVEQ